MAEATTTEETPEPAVEAPEVADLGDAGKKAIAAERARAVKAEKALQALQTAADERAKAEMTELERFKADNDRLTKESAKAALESTRYRVALEKGLPADLASRLQGDDYDSLAADADSLSALVAARPNGQPRADRSQGTKSESAPTDPAAAFAAHLNAQLGR